MNHSHIITVLLGMCVLGVMLVAIRLLESGPESSREEVESED